MRWHVIAVFHMLMEDEIHVYITVLVGTKVLRKHRAVLGKWGSKWAGEPQATT
jgi:hypothetical protein